MRTAQERLIMFQGEERRLTAAIYGWHLPPYKLWAGVRVYELGKIGELAKVVIVFNGEPFDALALERIGEPEYAVRRASGEVEYSPHSRAPDPQPLRLVQRPRYLKSG